MSDIKFKLNPKQSKELKDVCQSFNNDKGELINVLHKAQGIFGFLPAEVQEVIAGELKISVAQVYGVVTFYSFFSMTPKGQHPVSVCMGTACYVRGGEKILDEVKRDLNLQVGETSPDGKFSLGCLRCVGACGLAPVVMVGDKVFGRLAPDGVKEILKDYK